MTLLAWMTLLASLALAVVGAIVVNADLSARQKARVRDGVRGKPAANVPAIFLPLPPLKLVGSAAPDFTLPRLEDGRPVRLGDFRGHRPVVLAFGSFGCSVFCEEVPDLLRLHRAYGDRAEFLLVYIHEAWHALPDALRRVAEDPAVGPDPEAKRRRVLRAGLEHFRIPLPCLLDADGRVEDLYQAWPRRLVLVDRAGEVALDSGNFPGKPMPWEEIEAWLAGQDHLEGDTKARPDKPQPAASPDE
jgi:hypothetical protein